MQTDKQKNLVKHNRCQPRSQGLFFFPPKASEREEERPWERGKFGDHVMLRSWGPGAKRDYTVPHATLFVIISRSIVELGGGEGRGPFFYFTEGEREKKFCWQS